MSIVPLLQMKFIPNPSFPLQLKDIKQANIASPAQPKPSEEVPTILAKSLSSEPEIKPAETLFITFENPSSEVNSINNSHRLSYNRWTLTFYYQLIFALQRLQRARERLEARRAADRSRHSESAIRARMADREAQVMAEISAMARNTPLIPADSVVFTDVEVRIFKILNSTWEGDVHQIPYLLFFSSLRIQASLCTQLTVETECWASVKETPALRRNPSVQVLLDLDKPRPQLERPQQELPEYLLQQPPLVAVEVIVCHDRRHWHDLRLVDQSHRVVGLDLPREVGLHRLTEDGRLRLQQGKYLHQGLLLVDSVMDLAYPVSLIYYCLALTHL